MGRTPKMGRTTLLYKFYLNIQDIHIIFHYLSTSPPINSHCFPTNFQYLNASCSHHLH
jgi:hypothetical protein